MGPAFTSPSIIDEVRHWFRPTSSQLRHNDVDSRMTMWASNSENDFDASIDWSQAQQACYGVCEAAQIVSQLFAAEPRFVSERWAPKKIIVGRRGAADKLLHVAIAGASVRCCFAPGGCLEFQWHRSSRWTASLQVCAAVPSTKLLCCRVSGSRTANSKEKSSMRPIHRIFQAITGIGFAIVRPSECLHSSTVGLLSKASVLELEAYGLQNRSEFLDTTSSSHSSSDQCYRVCNG